LLVSEILITYCEINDIFAQSAVEVYKRCAQLPLGFKGLNTVVGYQTDPVTLQIRIYSLSHA